MFRAIFLFIFSMASVLSTKAQTVPAHAEGLSEELIEVAIDGGMQKGVLSVRKYQDTPTTLIVLIPGYPSVVRPEMENGVLTKSPLLGNFLIRARRHLIGGNVMTLIVDCHTSIGDVCKPDYVSSENRSLHIKALIDLARKRNPYITQVYLYSTSFGSVSSAFLGKYLQKEFTGIIHSASADPAAPKSFPQLKDFDYSSIKVKQAFIHHTEDPCVATPYSYIQKVSEKFKIPLVSVSGGSEFSGDPCGAFTQHGFRYKEIVVMKHVLKMIQSDVWTSDNI